MICGHGGGVGDRQLVFAAKTLFDPVPVAFAAEVEEAKGAAVVCVLPGFVKASLHSIHWHPHLTLSGKQQQASPLL